MKEVTTILVTLVSLGLVAGDCPIGKIHAYGHCSYRVQCINNINNIKLDKDCQGSSNYDVKVDVTVHNASDTLHVGAKPEILGLITTLTININNPRSDLSFLDSMYRLRNLYMNYNNLQRINNSPFRNLIYIENIDLSHNQISEIGEIFQFEIQPHKIQKISLAYNLIVEVPGDTFEELSSLIELDLSHNLIEELNEEPFYNLTNLQVLKLNNNQIKNLNGAMNNLYNLKHLYLRSNQIQNIDLESIKTINHLEIFDISKNQISNINPILFSRHFQHFSYYSTCSIILSDNFITHVPNTTIALIERFRKEKTTYKLSVLTKLNLSNNSITAIEYNAFSLIKLVSVDLSNNKLIDFVVNSDDLMYVEYLNLSGNFLNKLYYESFSSMRYLQNLDLSHNYMDYFPDQSLSTAYNLKYVNFTYNDILELHNLRITFHPDGGYLDLSNNALSVITIPKNDAIGLRELVLSSNNISDAYLIKLTDQHGLVRLDMSNNFIQELHESSLQLPTTLVILDLNHNEIYSIKPSAFHTISNLRTLKLSHNHLKIIQHGIFRGLMTLQNLDLSFNQIDQLDSKVFMDLKFLRILSLRYNGLNILDHESWFSHDGELTVYLDGNNLSCDWLAKALNDYHNGYSKMYPTVLESVIVGNSINATPCKQEVQNIIEPNTKYQTDERLLITSQQILKAVQEQTSYLKKYFWHTLLENAERKVALNMVQD